jgi:hypothetical protein
MQPMGHGPDRTRWRQATELALRVAISAGCALRVLEAFRHNPMDEMFSDPLRHWTFGRETLGTQPWAFIDPPLFQMWVSLVQKWSLGIPKLVAAYAAALSVLTSWLWYRFVRETVRSRILALAAWALLAWLPSWIAIFRYFVTETLFLPLMGASLWQTMRADRKRTQGAFCAMVLLWVLTGLTRGIAVPMGGLAGAWVWLRQGGKVKKAAAGAVIVLALCVPLAIRNYEFVNLWSPLGSGWPNQIYATSGAHDIHLHLTRDGAVWDYQFGSPSLYAPQLAPLSAWAPNRAGIVNVSADLREGARDWRAASEANALHGVARLRLQFENLVLVMLGESWPDKNLDCQVVRAALAMRWIWAPLLLLVAVAAALRWRDTLCRPLVPILIVCWFVFQAVSLLAVNEGRYRKPLEGLLVVEIVVLADGSRRLSRLLA